MSASAVAPKKAATKRASARVPRGRKPAATYQVNFRVRGDVLTVLEQAAERAQLPISTWLTLQGLAGAGNEALIEQLLRVRLGRASARKKPT